MRGNFRGVMMGTGIGIGTGAVALGFGGTYANGDAPVKQVSWSNDRGGSGKGYLDLGGAGTWTTNPVQMFGGANVITITVTDGNGLTNTDTITVTYTAPVV